MERPLTRSSDVARDCTLRLNRPVETRFALDVTDHETGIASQRCPT